MKKYLKAFITLAIAYVAIGGFNSWLLLWNHPVSYYYSLDGFLAAIRVALIEAPIVYVGFVIWKKAFKIDADKIRKELSNKEKG